MRTGYRRQNGSARKVLTGLLDSSGREYCRYLETVDPFGKAIFSVAWAGEAESQNWFHMARQYTEWWLHQQQIRDALNRPGIITPEFFPTLADTFFRALPHNYRSTEAEEGACIRVRITGEAGGDWFLLYSGGNWTISRQGPSACTTEIILGPDSTWKLLSKGIPGGEARDQAQIRGRAALSEPFFSTVAVMA